MSTRKENRGSATTLGAVGQIEVRPADERDAALARLRERPDIVEALNWILVRIEPDWLLGGEPYLRWDPFSKRAFPDEGFAEFILRATKGVERIERGLSLRENAAYAKMLNDAVQEFPGDVWDDVTVWL